MKERQIIFSAPMVRAMLDGSKTQTRRVVKPQPYIDQMGNACWNGHNFGQSAQGVPHIKQLASPFPSSKTKRVYCPYGIPGDQLWVRETWWHDEEDNAIIYRADPKSSIVDMNKHETGLAKYNWRPSIFMPRCASRITLEITRVRVEPLQNISDADSLAEGVYPTSTGLYPGSPRTAYQQLWESINGPGSWDANPWVWVIEFKGLPA